MKRTPEQIRKYIKGLMAEGRQHATDNQRKVLAAVLDKVLGDKTKRYELCEYLTGVPSTQEMDYQAIALLNWLGVSRFEDVPSDAVRAEIHACHTAALKAKGQLEMEGVA